MSTIPRIIIVQSHGKIGGAQLQCLDILRSLRTKSQIAVVFIFNGPAVKLYCDEGFRCICLSNKNNPSILSSIKLYFRFSRVMKSLEPNLIFCHSSLASYLARLYNILNKNKVVYTVHGWPWRGFVLPLRVLYMTLEKVFIYFNAAHYILVCNDSKKEASHSLGDRWVSRMNYNIIHNGVTQIGSIKAKKKRSISNILFAARVDRSKNHNRVLEWFSNTAMDCKLILAGCFTDSRSFKKQAESIVKQKINKIEFLGHVNNMRTVYDNSDILLHISHFETFPMVILEAMSVGIPVIANAKGGISEIVSSDTGCLLDNDSVICIEQAISELNDSSKYAEVSYNCSQLIKKKFSKNIMISKTEKLLLELIESHSKK